jgi:hypothetical protein
MPRARWRRLVAKRWAAKKLEAAEDLRVCIPLFSHRVVFLSAECLSHRRSAFAGTFGVRVRLEYGPRSVAWGFGRPALKGQVLEWSFLGGPTFDNSIGSLEMLQPCPRWIGTADAQFAQRRAAKARRRWARGRMLQPWSWLRKSMPLILKLKAERKDRS